jgi:hypothetical protein
MRTPPTAQRRRADAPLTTHARTQEVLSLAPGGDGGGGVDGAPPPGVRRLRLGERVALDELGPVVVQPDCTLRRIENWGALTPDERAAAQRRLGARNAARLGACRQLEAQGRLPPQAAQREGSGGEGGADADAEALTEPDLDALLAEEVEGEAQEGAHDEL